MYIALSQFFSQKKRRKKKPIQFEKTFVTRDDPKMR